MAVLWSPESSKCEFQDLQATAMSVDWSGNNILLAGKRCLAIKQLSQEGEWNDGIKKIARQSKYDVAGAEWCQTQQGQRLCAISSNQRVDIYHWRNGDLTGIHSLRGHTRVVSDTHWHREDHNLIATCSIDTFTHLWDLRDTRKPVLSFLAVAGASQVQWNKVASHLLATAHDGDVKLWDKRKGSSPIQYISAHLSKIHGLDWSPHHDYQLVTSSHDGTIKYFDINNPRRVESTITTNYPVWRAIYTPFGTGLMTMGVGWGGVARGEQGAVIALWVNGALAHRLVGHTDVVLQMQWRPNMPSNYQLVTWARDQTLRFWTIHPSLLKMCSHYLPMDSDVEDDALSDTMSYVSTSDFPESYNEEIPMVKLATHEPQQSFKEEFESIKNVENICVADMDYDHKTCTVRTESNGHIAVLKVAFPNTYAFDLTIPRFTWITGTNIDYNTTIKILQTINQAVFVRIKQHVPCLLHCLKLLVTCIQQIPLKSTDDSTSGKYPTSADSVHGDGDGTLNSAGDHCIPFPRTCGAKWCSVGTLVVFNRPPNAKRMSLKPESTTPRSLSSLSTPLFVTPTYNRPVQVPTTLSPTNAGLLHAGVAQRSASHSITTFYFQDRWKTPSRRSVSGSRTGGAQQITPKITLYKADHLFFLKKHLAEKYIIRNFNIPEMCEHNANIASSIGRNDLMQAWKLAALTATSLEQNKDESIKLTNMVFGDNDDSISWLVHPFGLTMIQALINHYAKVSDIQMAAMLCCAFSCYYKTSISGSKSCDISSNNSNVKHTIKPYSDDLFWDFKLFGSGNSPYNTIHNMSEVNVDSWTAPILKRDRTSSWSDSTDINPSFFDMSLGKCDDNPPSPMLDSSTVYLYQCYMKVYADVLHRWNLLDARAEVMKHVYSGEDTKHSGVELVSECYKCKLIVRESRCFKCSLVALNCAICNIGVRGSANACLVCGHGGHTLHMQQWFSKYDVCPTGCGCQCLRETCNIMER